MFGLFNRAPKPTLDSLSFDTSGYTPIQTPNPEAVRAWHSEEGDGVGIYLFTIPPNLPKVRTAKEIEANYAQGLQPCGGKVVEMTLSKIGGVGTIALIVKVPQQPSGLTFVASITLPFRDFSFVAKVQCEERGPTGLREAVLLDRHLAAGGTLAEFNADREAFDAEFSGSPLSRARAVLRRLSKTLKLDKKVAELPGWTLPSL